MFRGINKFGLITGWESLDFIDLVIAVAQEVYCIFMNIRMHPKAVDKRKTVIEINNLEDMSTFTSKKILHQH